MNCIEMFSGAGGLAKGLEMAGANHCAFVEWNTDACNTLRMNFNPRLVHEGDVRNFNFADFTHIDVIAGGPPCQPFSLGGKAYGNEDKRDMFPAAISAIRTILPKVFIFENVKGLLRASFSEYFDFILLQLAYPHIEMASENWRDKYHLLKALSLNKTEEPYYRISFKLVNAADYGIPQLRERVIIVGFRKDMDIEWSFPQPTHSKDALLWDMFVSEEYWCRHRVRNHYPANTVQSYFALLKGKYGLFAPHLRPWRTVRDAIHDLGEPDNKGDHMFRKGAREYPGHTGSLLDEPSKTLKAGSHGVPGGENMIKFPDGHVRYYSIAEAKRIQTFPDEYQISGSWSEAMRQLGNAVPVDLAALLAKSIFTAMAPNQQQQAPIKNDTRPVLNFGTVTAPMPM